MVIGVSYTLGEVNIRGETNERSGRRRISFFNWVTSFTSWGETEKPVLPGLAELLVVWVAQDFVEDVAEGL